MAKLAARKLKVFQAQFGFYDTVVAAASQAAALRAWGIRQNLFASGEARLAENPQAVEAALASPETPLRRVVGTTNPFELNPTGLPDIPDAPKKRAKDKPAKKAATREVTPPPVDRKRLDVAEATLRELDEARKQEEADLRRRQDELDAERDTAQAAYVASRKRATAALVEARQQYRAAGGIG